ncbi:histone deacetylase phd1 [Zalerion maritima]|uniref:Histone deacetylase n=1 Tax=Zalerion maritima TaxID=339359 RepID=A0AAD5WR08_9PEZI|nr:histone deacetylase phd1 [Zalerion maritima]
MEVDPEEDIPIVERFYQKPLDRPSPEQDEEYTRLMIRSAYQYGIHRPKGYTVSNHYNPEMEKHHFGPTHPMKPWRLTLAKSLITAFGMPAAMDSYHARAATHDELSNFHAADYLEYLATAAPQQKPPDGSESTDNKFNLANPDCPLFDGLYNYCSMSAGGSLDAARKICTQASQIACCWGGGLHHAKKAEASGFCYINDIVLAILELLRCYKRVLYLDIDIHHGDGVEEAFFSTDRVMTISFHKYHPETFFPGTGGLSDNGPKSESNPGSHHAINVPLNDGITDDQYGEMFKTIVRKAVDSFQPEAIAMQCGADSLGGDRLGKFNLQVTGHAGCVEFVKKLRLPLILFGGGGYTPRNVARAWAFETSIAIDCHRKIAENPRIPDHAPWRAEFRQESLLPSLEEILGEPKSNKNTKKRMDEIIMHITEQLRFVNKAPSVQSTAIPPSLLPIRDEVEERLKEEKEDRDENGRMLAESGAGIEMEF